MDETPRVLDLTRCIARGLLSIALLSALAFINGCHRPWYAHDDAGQSVSSGNRDAAPRRSASILESESAETIAANRQQTGGALRDPFERHVEQDDALTLAEIAADLKGLEDIDPAVREQFLADLREVNPEYWPQMVQTFRATIAYRQEHEAASENADAYHDDLSIAFGSTEEPALILPKATDPQQTGDQPMPGPLPETEPVEMAADLRSRVTTDEAAQPLEPPAEDPGVINASFDAQVVPNAPEHAAEPTTDHPRAIQDSETWQSLLDRAIAKWESESTADPATTAEIAEHARLRLLHAVAGNNEEAVRPISGAPPSHQDYWAKLLFALCTYLDEAAQPDVRRRASLARHHLDGAADLLGEIAMLEVRNLAFCTTIRGFGIYEPIERPEFRAGEQVKLYAEVVNYRSEPSEEGYQTILATSYEVLDASGQRVDSGDFPQVEDVCRTRRHDFHIQYGVDLPARIYPGAYRLQITIEDMLSRKLGRASAEFEIVADAAARK